MIRQTNSDRSKQYNSCPTLEGKADLIVSIINSQLSSHDKPSPYLHLIHLLKRRSRENNEFLPNDKIIAKVYLELLESDPLIRVKTIKVCEFQKDKGYRTAFDYRNIFRDYAETATTEKELKCYLSHVFRKSVGELALLIQAGYAPAITKPMRYSSQLLDIIQKFLDDFSTYPEELLDIGGGIGVHTGYIMKRYNIRKATVMDNRKSQDLIGTPYGSINDQPNIHYVLGEDGDITKHIITYNNFSFIMANNIILHLKNKKAALLNIIEMSKPESLICIVNNVTSQTSELQYLLLMTKHENTTIIASESYEDPRD